jgi:bifunctional DNase/RNase
MTHDLLRNVIDRLGATVERVVIDDLWRDIYYAKIYLLRGLEEFMIDARPSDAIAVAARFAAPIFVQSKILEVAGKEA